MSSHPSSLSLSLSFSATTTLDRHGHGHEIHTPAMFTPMKNRVLKVEDIQSIHEKITNNGRRGKLHTKTIPALRDGARKNQNRMVSHDSDDDDNNDDKEREEEWW
mmetsp:Transcript_35806/g.36266  ORF Transcript_35806/g.36266 Transcript_35806/m.36266 type:complete len:105 (+) Transcript_35806:414-728(+)